MLRHRLVSRANRTTLTARHCAAKKAVEIRAREDVNGGIPLPTEDAMRSKSRYGCVAGARMNEAVRSEGAR